MVTGGEFRFVVHPMFQTSLPIDFDFDNDVERNFLRKFTLGNVSSITTVSVDKLISPLIVFSDYGGRRNDYVCLLPKRKWGKWFSNEIRNRKDWPL